MGGEPITELDAVLARAWSMLSDALRQADSPLRTPALATIDDKGLPNVRTVALWRVAPEHRRLYFNTDRRSPKYAELKQLPWAMLLFYHPAAETQLRIRARVTLHENDELTHAGWLDLPAENRLLLMTQAPPGSEAPGPTLGVSKQTQQAGPDERAERFGYRNFVVLETNVQHLDWLQISRAGHRRAAFTWSSEGRVRAQWLYP